MRTPGYLARLALSAGRLCGAFWGAILGRPISLRLASQFAQPINPNAP